jgi:hypothetical protein
LFNLAEDPGEIRDLSEEPGQQARIRDMYERLEALMLNMGDTLDLDDFDIQLAGN